MLCTKHTTHSFYKTTCLNLLSGMTTMKMLLYICNRFIRINHFKMRHHAGSVVFQYMTMIHPPSGTVIGHPCNFYLALWFQVIGIFPGFVGRRLTIFFQYLKEETMQMKRVVH